MINRMVTAAKIANLSKFNYKTLGLYKK
jgi:hypothetical protein